MEGEMKGWADRIVAMVAIVGLVVVALLGGGPGVVRERSLDSAPRDDGAFGAQALEGGVSSFSGVHVAAPTVMATATPGLLVNAAGVNQVASFQDGGTELAGIRDGGGVVVSGPTAVATGQPALVADSLGVSNIFEVRDAATPVAYFANGGDLTLTGSGTLQTDLTVDDTLAIDDTDSTLTGTQTMSVTASFYQFNPASVLTLTLDTDGVADGDLLIIQNVGAQNVVIVDTGATIGGGNITLGANDTAIFVYGNSKWVMLSTANNS